MSAPVGTGPRTPRALAERLIAQRNALALLLGEEFPKVLALTRSRVRVHMNRLGTDNAFVAALDLAKSLDLLEDPYAMVLLMSALDLHEREMCQTELPTLCDGRG